MVVADMGTFEAIHNHIHAAKESIPIILGMLLHILRDFSRCRS